jgi:hypothetical protein
MEPNGVIVATTLQLADDRSRWHRLQMMIEAHPILDSDDETIQWFWMHYATSAAIAVRRLIDGGGGTNSLVRLMKAVEQNAKDLTRDDYLARWRESTPNDEMWEHTMSAHANVMFDRFAGEGAATVSADHVGRDLEELTTATKAVKTFVDKRIAHHDRKGDPTLTYTELSAAIDLVCDMVWKYRMLAVQLDHLKPTDLTGWGDAFDVAWNSQSIGGQE